MSSKSTKLRAAPAELPPLTPVELWRVAPPPEAEHLSSLSWDTLQRRYPEYVVQISKRRVGMRVAHALMIGAETAE
jgi:hypothetical protein